MRAFLGVQRWVGGRDERAYQGEGKGKGKQAAFPRPGPGDGEDEGGGLGWILGIGSSSILSRGDLKPPIPGISKRDETARKDLPHTPGYES